MRDPSARRDYRLRVEALHRELGIPADYARATGLPIQWEADELAGIGDDIHGRPQQMAARVAAAWPALRAAAAADGVELQLVSAYRSVDYQCGLIRRKLEAGQAIADILCVNAAPGYSQHHTGRALDLTTPGCEALEEEFERTDAFCWLARRAGGFDFELSYPRDNPWQIDYEPWHWAVRGGG